MKNVLVATRDSVERLNRIAHKRLPRLLREPPTLSNCFRNSLLRSNGCQPPVPHIAYHMRMFLRPGARLTKTLSTRRPLLSPGPTGEQSRHAETVNPYNPSKVGCLFSAVQTQLGLFPNRHESGRATVFGPLGTECAGIRKKFPAAKAQLDHLLTSFYR